jgi:hypothetical protein
VRLVHGPLALILVLGPAPAGCVSSHVGPGVLREDWNQPRRDPDPTRNPTEELRGNPWATETEERIPPPGEEPAPRAPSEQDRRSIDLAKRGAATFLAWAVAGWIPLLEVSGTFEEDPEQRQKLKRSDPE